MIVEHFSNYPTVNLCNASAASDRVGPFGDLLATCCLSEQIVGAVLGCTVHDGADIADEVLDRVADVAAQEERVRARILAGETTFDIFDLAHV